MDIIKYVLVIIIFLLAAPIGYWLSRITKEELKAGRKAFKAIISASSAIILITFFTNLGLDAKIFIIASMLFIIILASVSLKSRTIKRKTKIRKKKR